MCGIIHGNALANKEKGSDMKHSLKLIGASALALALSFDGFGVWKDIGRSLNRAPAPAPAASITFAPAVRGDAALAIVVGLDKEQVWKLAETFLDKLIAASGDADGEIKAAKAQLAEYKRNPFKDLPPGDIATFLKESGVLDADFRWAVLSMNALPDMNGGASIPDGLALALAGNLDLAKFMQVAQRKLAEKEEDAANFTEMTLEGEKIWRLVPQNEKSAKEMKDANADPYIAWLDRQVVIMALSRDAIVKQIRLYRKGEGTSSVMRGGDASGATAYVFMSGLGNVIRKGVSGEELEEVKSVIPNGDKVFYGLKSVDFKLNASSGESIQSSLRLCAATEQDADVLRTLSKTGLMSVRAQLSQQADTPKVVLSTLEALKVGGLNGVVEFSISTTVSDLVAALTPFMAEMGGTPNTGAGGEQTSPARDSGTLK